jgi:hypothetical protein
MPLEGLAASPSAPPSVKWNWPARGHGGRSASGACTGGEDCSRHQEVSVPLVLGTPVSRGSVSMALRNARAADLKIASAM